MVPFGAVVNVSETTGPDSAMRYNGFRAADLNGGAAPGYSTGQAQAAITQILNETLPKGMRFEWTDLTYQQILAGNTALLSSRSACCWSSSCWRRSMKACSCRWRSS